MTASSSDLDRVVRLLSAQASDDRDAEASAGRRRRVLDPINIRNLSTPGGRRRIFRILMTNACRFDCSYCPMRRSRAMERHALSPERLASVFLVAWRRGWADGLFVTTAIPGDPVRTADRTLELVESLRFRHDYDGYLHVKLVPGAEDDQVRRLALLCNRVSYNLEFACGESFEALAPEKTVQEGVRLLRIARGVRQRGMDARRHGVPEDPLRPAARSGATTQFVVGAPSASGGESDARLLRAAAALHAEGSVHHVHFAAFRPIRETPLEDAPETPVERERRLYQAEYLLRGYGFDLDEIPLDEAGHLPLDRDPKTAWAEAHPEVFPVEILDASPGELLRVPGIGPVTARRIVEERRRAALVDGAGVATLGVSRRAAPWLTLRGRRLGAPPPRQLELGLETVAPRPRSYEVSPGTFR